MNRRHILKTIGLGAVAGLASTRLSAARPSGFYVPAEENPHELTFMQWPVSRRVHPDPVFLDMVQDTIADIANTISDFEPVIMLADPSFHTKARQKLSANVTLWDIPTEDLWCRDSGPLFVVNDRGDRAVSHIQFNGWGEKQVNRYDSRIAGLVAERLGLPVLPSGLKGEPGGVEQDGHGLLMAHESSWVIENRNPGLSRDQIEQRLLKAYGAQRMIWSDGVWDQDITDYHIDSLARFTQPGRVLINLPDEPYFDDPFHQAALQTYDLLQDAGLDVDVIPEPNVRRVQDIEFVASYVNYYVCNGAVICAQFGDLETDQMAQDALKRHYPGRAVIALNVDPLGEMGGGIHCATQQMPAV